MREIKFRAFERKKKVWHYFHIPVDIGRHIEEMSNPLYYEHWCEYTGLKDKNGVEIYEGDILKYGVYTHAPVKVYWDKGLCGWELRSLDEVAGEHFIDFSGENDLGYNPWEVIGNIYENPELDNSRD